MSGNLKIKDLPRSLWFHCPKCGRLISKRPIECHCGCDVLQYFNELNKQGVY